MRKHVTVFLLLVVLIVVVSYSIHSPTCHGESESHKLDLIMWIEISDVNFENHTVLADVTFRIHSFPENTTTKVYAKLDDIDLNMVECSRAGGLVNGTYDFQGEAKGTKWYLNFYGELYPFDLNYVVFRLYPSLEYEINDTIYGLDYPISFNTVEQQVQFSGLLKANLENTWQIKPVIEGGEITILLLRIEYVSQFLIIVPLFWFLTLVASVPILSNVKNTKIQFYSSVLVFTPIFIFAIQSFIPPRSSLSIPEFLGLILILSSASMFLSSLPKFRTEKAKCYSEVAGLISSWTFSYVISLWLFQRFLFLLPVTIIMVFLIVLYAVMVVLRFLNYYKYERELYEPKIDY
jgi:hypothetical protein